MKQYRCVTWASYYSIGFNDTHHSIQLYKSYRRKLQVI